MTEQTISLSNYYNLVGENEKLRTTLKNLQKDLDLLETLLSCFKSAILDATNPLYRRGDNIVADLLRDELGLIKLNELKRRLENDK